MMRRILLVLLTATSAGLCGPTSAPPSGMPPSSLSTKVMATPRPAPKLICVGVKAVNLGVCA